MERRPAAVVIRPADEFFYGVEHRRAEHRFNLLFFSYTVIRFRKVKILQVNDLVSIILILIGVVPMGKILIRFIQVVLSFSGAFYLPLLCEPTRFLLVI